MKRFLLNFLLLLSCRSAFAQNFDPPQGFTLPVLCEDSIVTQNGDVDDVCLLCPTAPNGEVQLSIDSDIAVISAGPDGLVQTNCRDLSLFGVCGVSDTLAEDDTCDLARQTLFSPCLAANCRPLSQFLPTMSPTAAPTLSPTAPPTMATTMATTIATTMATTVTTTMATTMATTMTTTSLPLDQCPIGNRCPDDQAEVCVSRAPRMPKAPKSVKMPSAKSPKSTKAPSVKSEKSPKSTKAPSVKSPKSPKSEKSTKAPSVKSPKSPKSTKAPSAKSTKAPSAKSTKAPSAKSTKAPSAKSTKAPSAKSTKAPSAKSTKAPSVKSAKAKKAKQPKLVTRCVRPENGLWMRETFVGCGACPDDQ